ncbi:AMP-binding protein [Candidatus Bathyarchaeota archaeon]|nr:AMP-binding protein [Candidatus Bathyarchaeota archaeon]
MNQSQDYPDGVPISIKYPEMPLYEFWANSTRKFPDRDALIYLGARYSYSELWEQIQSLARHLKSLGIEKGDRVGLILPNCPQFIIAYYSVILVGATVVAVNPLMTVGEIERQVNSTECKILIILDRLLDRLPEKYPELIVARGAYFAPPLLRLLGFLRHRKKDIPKGAILFEDLTRGPKLAEPAGIDPKDDVAMIMFTSGTTGQPKGVMLSHYALMANALQSYYWLRGWGYSSKPQSDGYPIILCAMPFFHSYGLVVLNEAVSFGCTMVLVPKPTAVSILEAIQKYKITHAPLIPRMIKEMLLHPDIEDYDLSSLTTASSGGAPIQEEDMKKLEELANVRLYQGYGLTEAGPSVSASTVLGAPNYLSVGLPYPDTEVKIMDLQIGEVEMPPGEIGEVVVKGPQLMKGYWKDPDTTTELIKDGWLHTGDTGYLDENGHLYIVGRNSEGILARGHRVWPTEVEEVLNSHPKVEKSVAFGVPDPLRCSTDIRAGVKLVEGIEPSPNVEEELLSFCYDELEEYQVPAKISFWEDIPTTPMGKIDRAQILEKIDEKINELMQESKIPQEYL